MRQARWYGAACALWIGCTAVYFVTAPGRIDMVDGAIRYEITDSLLNHGRFDILNSFTPGTPGRGGRHYSYYPIGTPLLSLPFLAAGWWLGHDALESKQFAFSLTSVPFAAATVATLFLIFGRLGCSPNRAAGWALVAAFCTPVWVYAGSSFDVAQQTLFILVAVWAAVEAFANESLRWAMASGLSFALLINVQETYVVLAACVADVAPATARSVWERLTNRVTITIFALLAAGLATVLAYNAFKFGNPLNTGRGTVPHPLVGNPAVGLAGLLVSPAKSIFLYCPVYACALLGLWRLLRSDRQRYAPITACLVIHIAMISTLKFWAGEWAWGPRYLIASVPLACIGLPFAAARRPWNAAVTGVCAVSLAVQLLAISVDHQRYYLERSSYHPFFWVNESTMYTDSPLLARPGELIEIAGGRDREGPLLRPQRALFLDDLLNLRAATCRAPQRPGMDAEVSGFRGASSVADLESVSAAVGQARPTGTMTAIGALTAAAAFALLWWLVRPGSDRQRSSR